MLSACLIAAAASSPGCGRENPASATRSAAVTPGSHLGKPLCLDCNVVLISADTLRRDHLGTYGYHRNTSPNIDRLAARAYVFEDALAQDTWTLPTHMSIFTGLYPARHGVVTTRSRLPDSTFTLADVLHEHGYRCGAFTGGAYLGRKYNYHTFDVYDDSGSKSGENFDHMLEWLEQNSDQRFFLFWHDFTAHVPYVNQGTHDVFTDTDYEGIVNLQPDDDDQLCKELSTPSLRKRCQAKSGSYLNLLLPRMTAEDIRYVADKYDGEILQLDERIGRLLDALDDLGLRERTVVVFTADHGETLADRKQKRRFGHGTSGHYQELIGVPLIIYVPGVDGEAGTRVARMVESLDIMPTTLEIVGRPIPKGIDGRSMFGFAEGDTDEEVGFAEHFKSEPSCAIKYRQMKLMYFPRSERWELYDLAVDPHERINLIGDDHPMTASLKRMLLERMSDRAVGAPETDIGPQLRRQLDELGYLQHARDQ